MNSDYYRRELLRKQEQQAAAERKAGDARKKEADKRFAASKAKASAASTKSETTQRSKNRDAERYEKAANDAARDAATAQGKVASLAKEIATLQARLAKAEQDEGRKRQAEQATAQRRAAEQHRQVMTRLARTEADVIELRDMRPPKAERLRILMLAASAQGDLRVNREHTRIRRATEGAQHRELIDFDVKASATTDDLLDGLVRFRPHVVHFSGHSNKELLVFEDDLDAPHKGVPVKASAFAKTLAAVDDPPLLVVLNSCDSAGQAEQLVEGFVPFAVGMTESVEDASAISYAVRFYTSIADGTSLETAHMLGRAKLEMDGLVGPEVPQLFHAADADPRSLTLVVPPEELEASV